MKKLIITLAAIVVTGVASAASLNWRYYANATYNGDTVYILKAYDAGKVYSLAEIAAAAVDQDDIAQYGSGRNTGYRAGGATEKHSISGWNDEENGGQAVTFYQVLVHDGQYFAYETSGTTWGGQIAEPAESSGIGSASAFTTALSSATWVTAKTEGVPEPTSGLLLVLGGAMLALRRRR